MENFINTPDGVFLVKLLGVVSLGSLIGEFHRGSIKGKVGKRLFISSVIAGGFLAYIISAAYYYNIRQNDMTAFLLGAFLSYQNERYLSKFISTVVEGKFIIAFINSVKYVMRDLDNGDNGEKGNGGNSGSKSQKEVNKDKDSNRGVNEDN